jgi:hypothetical protein
MCETRQALRRDVARREPPWTAITSWACLDTLFLDYRRRNMTIRKNRVKQIDFFTLPPAAAWYVRRVLHCDARIMERGRNLNFCHLASNVLNRAAKTNTAHVYCHDSFINEMTRLKRGSFEEKNLASNC